MENSYIIIFSLILLGFLLWKELKRKNKARLILRISANCLAVTALICLAIPITYQKKADPKAENAAILITEGFEKDSLNAFKNIPAFSTDPVVTKNNRSVKLISDLAGFMSMNQEYSKFHILGYGLEDQELGALKDQELIFHPSPLPTGVQSVYWTRKIRSGERFLISGTFRNATDQPVKLILKGLGTSLDSVGIPAGKSGSFDLKTIPRHLDKAVYSLIGISAEDTVTNEKVPVFVESQNTLKLLILSSAPDFETKFLKNWLFENKYSIAVRSAISKNKFSTGFLNSSKTSLDRISTSVLENFDLLISDPNELSALSQAESQAIRNQVSKGMGLVMIADSIGKGPGFFKELFETKQLVRADEKTISLKWDGNSAKKMTLSSSGSFKITATDESRALVSDEKGNILVSSKLYGRGRILLSSLNDTYTWMLGNDLKAYSSYWSELIGKAARKRELNSVWALKDPFPQVNKENIILLEAPAESIPSALSQGETLKFTQDPVLGFQWNTSLWPQKSGWNSLENGNTSDLIRNWYYVFKKNDWAVIRAGVKIKNTIRHSEQAFSGSSEQKIAPRFYRETIPPIYFFILFILCCTYLWLEAKMF